MKTSHRDDVLETVWFSPLCAHKFVYFCQKRNLEVIVLKKKEKKIMIFFGGGES